jgi:DNA-binding MarR family transcriptional regulator
LHLTAKGKRLISEIFPKHAARITEVLEALTPDEQAELARLTRKLGLSAGQSTLISK